MNISTLSRRWPGYGVISSLRPVMWTGFQELETENCTTTMPGLQDKDRVERLLPFEGRRMWKFRSPPSDVCVMGFHEPIEVLQ